MKIIICGAGQVGRSIASQLANEENHITVIDTAPELVEKITDTLQVNAILGHASHPSVLERAGAQDADMVIAVTLSDEVNMIACQVAHSLFNVPVKIARIRHQDYLDTEWEELYHPHHLPIDVIISPEMEVARTVHDRLHVPGATDMIPFVDGKIKVVAIRCTYDCAMLNMPVYKAERHFSELNLAIIGIIRSGEFLIPDQEELLQFNDDIYFVADSKHVQKAIAIFGYELKEARRIVIVGGGNIGLFLAERLEAEGHDLNVKIIELSRERAEYAASRLPHTKVIHGSALDQSILEEANIANAETIIALSNDDKVNILSSLLAKRSGCRRAVTLINNSAAYGPLVTSLGVDVVVSPRETTVSSILRHTRTGKIRAVHSLCEGQAEIMEAEAVEGSPIIGKAIADLDIPEEILVAAIYRANTMLIPDTATAIHSGDRIIILCRTHMVKKVEKIFAVKFEYIY